MAFQLKTDKRFLIHSSVNKDDDIYVEIDDKGALILTNEDYIFTISADAIDLLLEAIRILRTGS